jgi:hypothetical protein
MYLKSSREQSVRDGPPDWGLDERLTIPLHEKAACYEVKPVTIRVVKSRRII